VLSADGKTAYSMFFVHPVWRSQAGREPELQFMETAVGMPIAIQTWWHPNELLGWEFVYPKDQALRLAKGIGQPVTFTETPMEPWAEPEIAEALPSGDIGPVAESAVPSGEIIAGEPVPQDVPTAAPPAALPKTASRTPVIGLAGGLLIAGALFMIGLRTART
jgi:hypothetical protein